MADLLHFGLCSQVPLRAGGLLGPWLHGSIHNQLLGIHYYVLQDIDLRGNGDNKQRKILLDEF